MEPVGIIYLTPNPRAADADQIRPQLNWIADVIRERVIGHKPGVSADVAAHVRARAMSLLDDWSSLANLADLEAKPARAMILD